MKNKGYILILNVMLHSFYPVYISVKHLIKETSYATSYLSFPIFSRIERKLIKSFVQLKDLDIST